MFHFLAEDFNVLFPILLRDILTEVLDFVSGAVADCGENCRGVCHDWLNRRLLPLLFLIIRGVSSHSGSPNRINIASFSCSYRYIVNILTSISLTLNLIHKPNVQIVNANKLVSASLENSKKELFASNVAYGYNKIL